MRLEMIGERVERLLDPRLVGERRRDAEVREPGAAEGVARRTGRAHRCPARARRRERAPSGRPSRSSNGPRAVRPFGAAEMDLVAVDRRAGRAVAARDRRASILSAVSTVSTSSRPSPSTAAGRPLDAVRIGDACGRASGSRRRGRARGRRAARCAAMSMSQPCCAQEGEIGDGRLRARQDDEVGVAPGSARRAARRPADTPGSMPQRIEIVEIGDARQHRHGDRERRRRASPRRARDRAHPRPAASAACGSHGTTPSDGQPVRSLDRRERRRRTGAASPRNLLMRKPRMRARSAGSQHRMRADEAGDHAAAVDVADQDHRHVGGLGKAHIGDVAGAQVDLGRAARALRPGRGRRRRAEPREALQHRRQQLAPCARRYSRAAQRADAPALHDRPARRCRSPA